MPIKSAGRGCVPGRFSLWCAALMLLVLWSVGGARADDFADAVAGLAGDSYGDRAGAVEKLGALGDPRAVPLLKALGEDRVFVASDKRVLISPGDDKRPMTDAATGADAGVQSGAEHVRLNNRVRSAIEGALARLTLFSPNASDRLGAAREAQRHPSADQLPGLQKALAAEKAPEVRRALERAIAAAEIGGGDSAQKLAGIALLAGSLDPETRVLLAEAANDSDPAVRAAARKGVDAIDSRMCWIDFGLNLFQGLSLGSVLLLAAIGLAITFGVMGVINMAHGELMMLGAYTTFCVQEAFRQWLPPSWLDWYLIASIPAAFLCAGAVGVLLERSVIRFLYKRPLETLLATWGISLMLQQLIRTTFGAPNKQVGNPSWMTGGFEIAGGASVTWNRVWILLFCFAVLGGLALILRRTEFGLHMRAVTQNRRMASAMGIRTGWVDALTFGLGSGIAGIAGVALSQIGNVSPNLGTFYIVDSFMVVVFGGVGNLAGTLVGAMGIGIVDKFLEPFAGAVLGKIAVLVAVILFIQVRPRGLFALKGRSVET